MRAAFGNARASAVRSYFVQINAAAPATIAQHKTIIVACGQIFMRSIKHTSHTCLPQVHSCKINTENQLVRVRFGGESKSPMAKTRDKKGCFLGSLRSLPNPYTIAAQFH